MAKITVYCQPGAKQTQVAGWHDGKLKIQLKAPPVDGAANKALLAFMAELCQVAKSHITLEQGSTSRTKRLHIDGMDEVQLQAALAPYSDTAPPTTPISDTSTPPTALQKTNKKNSKK